MKGSFIAARHGGTTVYTSYTYTQIPSGRHIDTHLQAEETLQRVSDLVMKALARAHSSLASCLRKKPFHYLLPL